ncbi:MAG: hypothetical protein CW335_00080 [Clostridiales bacterium]|nr:hypothetical protein [Clostridiales bacterium]
MDTAEKRKSHRLHHLNSYYNDFNIAQKLGKIYGLEGRIFGNFQENHEMSVHNAQEMYRSAQDFLQK